MIKMHGTILELGTLDIGNLTFSKNCEITYPEKVPIKDGFTGVISKDGDKFVIDAEIYDKYADIIDKYERAFDGHVPIGSQYIRIESDRERGIQIVNKAHLNYVTIITCAANESLYLNRVEKKKRKIKKEASYRRGYQIRKLFRAGYKERS